MALDDGPKLNPQIICGDCDRPIHPGIERELYYNTTKQQVHKECYYNTAPAPDLKSNKVKGLRYNEGKLIFSAIPPKVLEEVAKVLTQGAVKYARNNWRKGFLYSEALDSLHRHLNKFELGEALDKESGLHHLSHAIVNAIFLRHFEYNRNEYGLLDDRYEYIKDVNYNETTIYHGVDICLICNKYVAGTEHQNLREILNNSGNNEGLVHVTCLINKYQAERYTLSIP